MGGGGETSYVDVEVTIRGPAADLAVILAGPAGKTYTQPVEKIDLMDNVQTLDFWSDQPWNRGFQPGFYTLTVKLVEPEKVIHQEKVQLE